MAAEKSITRLECERAFETWQRGDAISVAAAKEWPDDKRERYRLMEAVEVTPELDAEVKKNERLVAEFRAWLDKKRVRATFSTPEDLKAKVTDALWDWEKRHGGGDPGSAPADPRKYLQKLAARTGHIDIRGFEVGSGKVHQFPIDDLYIPLTTAAPPEPGLDGASYRNRRETGDG